MARQQEVQELGEQQRSSSLRGMLHSRLSYLSSQHSASLEEGNEPQQDAEDAAEWAPEPISRYETLPPKATGVVLAAQLVTRSEGHRSHVST